MNHAQVGNIKYQKQRNREKLSFPMHQKNNCRSALGLNKSNGSEHHPVYKACVKQSKGTQRRNISDGFPSG